jgi:hypothetical protein
MNITAIIANRNEYAENLTRTISSIRRQGVTIDVITDKPAMGCGWRRHEGILKCKTDGVFLCDGHMEFDDGFFDNIRCDLAKNPDDLLCTRMQSVDRDWNPMGGLYAGAFIRTMQQWGSGEYIPISGTWRKGDQGNGPIGCVMGANYALTKTAYERMGRPLGMLRAWGCDEELLSIACWMTGGKVRLVDGVASHMYAAPRVGGREILIDEIVRVWANREAMLQAIPMHEKERDEYRAWMERSVVVQKNKAAILMDAKKRKQDIYRLCAALSGGSMTWEQYRRKWINKEPTEGMVKQKKTAEKPKKQNVPNLTTQMHGVKCPHCHVMHDPKQLTVTHTYANKNRRHICEACEKPFISIYKPA